MPGADDGVAVDGVAVEAVVDCAGVLALTFLPGIFWQAANSIRLAGTAILPSMRIVFMGSLVVHNARLMVLIWGSLTAWRRYPSNKFYPQNPPCFMTT